MREAAWTSLKAAAAVALGLPLVTTLASAQPDYGPAHYTPMSGCEKWWANASDAVAYYASKWAQSGPGGHYFCVIHDMEGELEKIVIHDLRDHTFYAKLVICREGRVVEVDARPSDAIALGVAGDTPIYVEDGVLRQVCEASPGS